jgi:hypothetical protein
MERSLRDGKLRNCRSVGEINRQKYTWRTAHFFWTPQKVWKTGQWPIKC